ncbi:hypothetical protein V6U78_05940 [Marinospirillum sp. MEB164]|uniref:Uncharacterized protein n=1 Tax=Marinospirillum alkalitolerans TaxID=3123374 RepID=A0ABW8PW97_9GAMM
MTSSFLFRLDEMRRFIKTLLTQQQGRRFLIHYFGNALMLSLLMLIALSALLFGLFESLLIRKRTFVLSLGMLATLVVVLPLATMPFFSSKDLLNQLARLLRRQHIFQHLNAHVFYRQSANGSISLHLAKAHTLLSEKHQLLLKARAQFQALPARPQDNEPSDKLPTAIKTINKHLAVSLARSIRDAVKLTKERVQQGVFRPEQKITGATYAYLFGTAKSKLGLKRHQPGWLQGFVSNLFYRLGAMHALFMYFVIHEQLPQSFDPVHFVATVGEVIGQPPAA